MHSWIDDHAYAVSMELSIGVLVTDILNFHLPH
jgi:hypothetical protein